MLNTGLIDFSKARFLFFVVFFFLVLFLPSCYSVYRLYSIPIKCSKRVSQNEVLVGEKGACETGKLS